MSWTAWLAAVAAGAEQEVQEVQDQDQEWAQIRLHTASAAPRIEQGVPGDLDSGAGVCGLAPAY